MKKEIWKEIKGYEETYSISSLGRTKTLRRNKILKQKDTRGYKQVGLSVENVCKTVSVHRIVAIAFIPNPDNKPQVNHINGIKDDNRVENLEWCTRKENMEHASKHGLIKTKAWIEKIATKLTEEKVVEIKRLLKQGYQQNRIADMYGVTPGSIAHIYHGRCWTHVEVENDR